MKGKSNRTQNVIQRNLVWVVNSVLAAGLWISTADAARRDTVFLKEMAVHYPEQCKPSMAGKTGTTGLCLRVSTSPKVSGDFRVRPAQRWISDRQTAGGVP
ncbi:hypothetical protein, partial [Methyloparacoccus murrellii]